jgi:hypothetical protein
MTTVVGASKQQFNDAAEEQSRVQADKLSKKLSAKPRPLWQWALTLITFVSVCGLL